MGVAVGRYFVYSIILAPEFLYWGRNIIAVFFLAKIINFYTLLSILTCYFFLVFILLVEHATPGSAAVVLYTKRLLTSNYYHKQADSQMG